MYISDQGEANPNHSIDFQATTWKPKQIHWNTCIVISNLDHDIPRINLLDVRYENMPGRGYTCSLILCSTVPTEINVLYPAFQGHQSTSSLHHEESNQCRISF